MITTTRLQAGQGLIGAAVERQTILLLDEGVADQRLRRLMSRDDIVSSLVAPLMPERGRTPSGVLNLRTSNPARRFTQEHVELLRRLLTLAGVALGTLQLTADRAPQSS